MWTYRVLNQWTDRYSGTKEVHYQIYRDGKPYYTHGNPGIVRTLDHFTYHTRNMTPA